MTDTSALREKIGAFFTEATGYTFSDPELIFGAFTHSSAKEMGLKCNERQEFLGDAVLGLVVSEYLFREFPDREEGELSVIKSVMVSAKFLARAAKKLQLENMIVTGKGIAERKIPQSILANTFEAVIAALYLDAGLEPARKFVLDHLVKDHIDGIVHNEYGRNYKSILQDYAQKHAVALPTYKVTREEGPDHRKRFEVSVDVDRKAYGPMWGYSKKEAEQGAARYALIILGVIQEPLPTNVEQR